jgi:hypothetical protein
MTTPQERTRAVVQTKQFLEELLGVPDLPDQVRRQALVLLRHYPGSSELVLANKVLPHLFAAPVAAVASKAARGDDGGEGSK